MPLPCIEDVIIVDEAPVIIKFNRRGFSCKPRQAAAHVPLDHPIFNSILDEIADSLRLKRTDTDEILPTSHNHRRIVIDAEWQGYVDRIKRRIHWMERDNWKLFIE